jgi:hypothetical protein
MKLNWSDYKSDNGSLAVHFPGGFQLSVHRNNDDWKLTKRWRVWWWRGEHSAVPHKVAETKEMKRLYAAWFPSRRAAQKAAEDVFVPMALFAPWLVAIPRALRDAEPTAADAFRNVAKKRRAS